MLFCACWLCGQKLEPALDYGLFQQRLIKTSKDDPYSYVVADYVESYKKEYKEDYYNHLEVRHFTLRDIDGNGTKELLLGAGRFPVNPISLYAVYVIRNGNAVYQEEFWLPPEHNSSLFENGTIRGEFDNDGDLQFYYYRFENGTLKLQTMLVHAYNSDNYYLEQDSN